MSNTTSSLSLLILWVISNYMLILVSNISSFMYFWRHNGMTNEKHKQERIFGTPPEPLFNCSSSGMKPELLEECLIELAKENGKCTNSATSKEGHFKYGNSSEIVFLTCDHFKLSPRAKYLALELFEKFMVQHIYDLYKHVLSLKDASKKRDWLAIQERVCNQIPLRIVSCCQVASKLTSHYRVVTPSKARNTLSDFGHRYSSESILQSELRILKTLDYRVMLNTPLLYLETLLEIIGHNDASVKVKIYHNICLQVLDVYYIKRQSVYNQLFLVATGKYMASKEDRGKFAAVENDTMLLSVAVIASAAYLVDQSQTDKIIKNLSHITRIPPEDILDFATILIQNILKDS